MHLRTATLASVTIFRLCLSSNTYLVVKSRQRLQSNLWRKEDEQSSSFSPHQSRVWTQNVHSHSQVCGLPSRAYYTTTSTRNSGPSSAQGGVWNVSSYQHSPSFNAACLGFGSGSCSGLKWPHERSRSDSTRVALLPRWQSCVDGQALVTHTSYATLCL